MSSPATLEDVVAAIESLEKTFERLSAALEARPAPVTYTYEGPALPVLTSDGAGCVHAWEEFSGTDGTYSKCLRCGERIDMTVW